MLGQDAERGQAYHQGQDQEEAQVGSGEGLVGKREPGEVSKPGNRCGVKAFGSLPPGSQPAPCMSTEALPTQYTPAVTLQLWWAHIM